MQHGCGEFGFIKTPGIRLFPQHTGQLNGALQKVPWKGQGSYSHFLNDCNLHFVLLITYRYVISCARGRSPFSMAQGWSNVDAILPSLDFSNGSDKINPVGDMSTRYRHMPTCHEQGKSKQDPYAAPIRAQRGTSKRRVAIVMAISSLVYRSTE